MSHKQLTQLEFGGRKGAGGREGKQKYIIIYRKKQKDYVLAHKGNSSGSGSGSFSSLAEPREYSQLLECVTQRRDASELRLSHVSA